MPEYEYEGDISEKTMEMGSKAAKLATSISFARIISFVIIGAAFVVLARLLGPSGYGVYTVAVAAAGLVGALGDFGMSWAIIKSVSESMERKDTDRVRSILVNSLFILIIIDGAFALVMYLLSSYIAATSLHNITYLHTIQIASLLILLGPIWTDAMLVLVAMNRGRRLAYVTTVQTATQALIGITLVLLGFGPTGAVLGIIAGLFLGTVAVAAGLVKQLGIRFRWSHVSFGMWKELLGFSAPLGASGTLLGLAGNFSVIYLGYYSTSAILGNFGITSKVGSVFDVFVSSVGLTILPLFSAAFTNRKTKRKVSGYFNYSIYTALLFLTPAVFYVLSLATPFVYTVVGGAYSRAPLYIAMMSLGLVAYIFGAYTTNLLISAGKVRQVSKYNIMNAILLFVLTLALVPALNGLGLVVISFLIIPISTALLATRGAKKTLRLDLELGRMTRVVVAGGLSALLIIPLSILFGSNNIPLLITAFAEQVLFYPAVLAKIGAVGKKDLHILRETTKNLPMVGDFMRLATGYTGIFLR